ncbi:hypothetical protein [Lentimicrobium sp.]|uniref:hypothetical protein n=1 Tax=Lentimicrobium sp. TaxID=2034841 RepID=UPI00345EF904
MKRVLYKPELKYKNMKTFYRIFGGKRVRRALVLFALVSSIQAISQPCSVPTEAFLTGNATICQGSTTDILINISGGVAPWRVIYSINGALQPEITGIISSPYIVTTGTAGDYKIEQVLDADDCTGAVTGSPVTIQVNPFPTSAGAITGNAAVCQSTNGVSYSVPAISNATGYIWALPSGATIASGNNTNSISVNFSSAASSGNISVYGTNSCGNGASSGLFVTVSPLPGAAGVISGSTSVCQGQSGLNYSVSPVSGATSYEWALPAGATITSGSNSNSITVSYSTSASSGPVTVRGINSCGNGSWSPDLQVTVNQLPGNPGPVTGSSAVCQGQTGVTYSVPAIAFANGYEWSLPTGASIISGANTNQITVNFSPAAVSGDILVRGLNGCGAGQWSAAFAVTVSNLPLAAGNVTGPALVCSNQTNLVYSIAPVAYAAGYEWQYPAGFTVSGPSNGSTLTLNASGATAGIVRARAVNSCGSGTWSPDLSLAVHPLPTANAGPDAQICATASHTLSGNATDYSSVSWSSSGSGSFVNQNSLSATYIPSPADVAAGSVVLTLTVTSASPCIGSTTDQMILTLLSLPVVNAGPDFSSCGTSGATLGGSMASNYGSLLWTTSGSGTFSNPAALHPVYNPDANDVATGSVTLTLTAYGNAGCAGESASDQMTLFLNPLPVANAGNAASTCEGESYTVTDATASNFGTLTWSSNGTGTFTNNGTLNPTYTPSLADAISGSVNLTLTATPLAPCLGNATSVKTLSITRLALANAGPDGNSCGNTPFTLSSASATNYSSLLWTSSGSGSFVNPGILNATYIPGAGDLVSGSVTLTLTLTGNSPCATPVSDDMVLSIGGEPTAYAGLDGQTCETTPFTVTTATATNYSAINWTTSGTGILSDAGSLTPTYTPSNADALAGIVTL